MTKPYKVTVNNRKEFLDFCNKVDKYVGVKPIILTASTEKPKRSIDQNSYYWKVIIGNALIFYKANLRALIEDLMKAVRFELTPDFIHSLFKLMFNSGKSTTNLKTDSMSEYWDKVREHFYHEHKVDIPEPNEEQLTTKEDNNE